MYGAILGDIIGEPYEFDRGDKTKEFSLFSGKPQFTDDSVMTIAVAEAMMDSFGKSDDEIRDALVKSMQSWGRRYPYMKWFYELYPDAGNLPQLEVNSAAEQNLPQAGVDLEQQIFSIPWGHNKLIIDKCKGDRLKALFFVKETLENSWSRPITCTDPTTITKIIMWVGRVRYWLKHLGRVLFLIIDRIKKSLRGGEFLCIIKLL